MNKMNKIFVFVVLLNIVGCYGQYVGHVTRVSANFNGGKSGHYVITLDVPYKGPRCGNSPYTSVVPIDYKIGDAIYKIATAALLSGNSVNANIKDCTYWPAAGPNLYDLAMCAPGVQNCNSFGPGYT